MTTDRSKSAMKGIPCVSPLSLLPTTCTQASHNMALNFPVTMSRKKMFLTVSDNSVAAWYHFGGPCCHRFAWNPHEFIGPRAILMRIPNGPAFFHRLWTRLFIHEIVCKSKRFASCSAEIIRYIVRFTETCMLTKNVDHL